MEVSAKDAMVKTAVPAVPETSQTPPITEIDLDDKQALEQLKESIRRDKMSIMDKINAEDPEKEGSK